MSQARTQPRADARSVEPPPDRDTEKRVVEALIFVSDEPVTLDQIAQVLTGRSQDDLRQLVEDLEEELERSGRGLRIEAVAGGYRFSTRPELATWIRTHFRNRNRARLSPASVETLAVVAYKQPITAPEIQEIRGVDPQGSIKTLLEKRLIRIAGKKKVVGRPFLYATSKQFLMHFGLGSIDDLPPIEDFERLAGAIESIESSAAGAGPGSDAGTPESAEFGMQDQGEEGEGMAEGEGPAVFLRGNGRSRGRARGNDEEE